jgi:hypothetical protein
MTMSDRFLRFAAECEQMAKFTKSAESAMTWRRMAERWLRCAELVEQRDAAADAAGAAKRHRKSEPAWAH